MKNIKKKLAIILSLMMFFLNISVVTYAKSNEATLIFSKNDGKLMFDPERKFFMDEQNILPGSKYEYDLFIENRCPKTYKLYFKVTSKNKSKKAEELLKKINMKVTYEDGTIYQGQANGKIVNKDNSLEKYIYLGEYDPNKKTKIHVDLDVDKNLSNDLQDVISYVNWDFCTQLTNDTDGGNTSDNGNNTGNSGNNNTGITGSNVDKNTNNVPKTGDDFSLIYLLVGLLISISLVTLVNKKKLIKR